MKLTGKTYDTLKALAQLWLPAAGTLYFALAGLWGLPAAEEVVGTIVAVDTFLGVILGISSSNFSSEKVGAIVSQELESGGKTFSLELDGDPEEIEDHDEVRFAVQRKPKAEGTILAKDPMQAETAARHRTGRHRK